MPARVVLHASVLDPFLLAVKSALGKRGVEVVQGDTFTDDDLHLVTKPGHSAPNVIEVAPLLVAPYRALIHPKLRQPFKADAVPYASAKTFFEDLRADHANGKRYAVADLPDKMLAVVVADGDDDDTLQQMIKDALSTKRPVVLVAEDPMNSGMLGPLANSFPSVIVYHDVLADLLHKADAVISQSGAGVILAHIHRTPAVLYSPAPFDHINPVVGVGLGFDAALQQAFATGGVYAKYLYWFFKTQALRADEHDFADRLLAAFQGVGFGVEHLGLEVTSKFARKIADTHTAAQSLTAFLEEQPEISKAKLTKTLKVSSRSWVFQARINGEKVVLKRFHDADPAHTVRSLQGELAFMEAAFGTSEFGVNRCLHAWPDAGTVVLSYAGGKRIVDAIAAQSGAKRAALLTKAGAWLNAYAMPRHRQTTFGPLHWVKELGATARHKLTREEHELFDAGLAKLGQLARQVMGSPVVQAASHGDFAGINLHIDKDQVIGVDIQGECWQALAKDAAHFIVWQALHDPRDTGDQVLGIDLADMRAFLIGLPLLEAEIETTLPFFIGWKLMHHLIEKADLGADTSGVMTFLQAYLADLDGLLEIDAAQGLSKA